MDATASFDLQLVDFCKRALMRAGTLRRAARSPSGFSADMIGKLAFQRRQAQRRASALRSGKSVPPILIASVTRRCNLDCAGCYSKELRPEGAASIELSDERFLELFHEAIDLGVGTIMLAGGEPLLRRDLLEKTARLGGLIAPVFTNGTLVDSGWLELFGQGSLVPIFSIEGESAFTAKRRGYGVHEAVMEQTARLREAGIPFGLSITLTSRNYDAALAPSFLEWIDKLGASALFLIEYVPAVHGTEGLALGPALHARLCADTRLDGLPYPVLRLPGDEAASGGCLAAGRGFIHLAPDGSVEACPFAPYSDRSVADTGLAEALGSPLMRAIRERHGELDSSGGGCALLDRGGWIASLAGCVGTEAGAAVRGRAQGAERSVVVA
jgi:MoaA/NifB/PqqE/SkfB family radical SAM enzyme